MCSGAYSRVLGREVQLDLGNLIRNYGEAVAMILFGIGGHVQGAKGQGQGPAHIQVFFSLLKIKQHHAYLSCVGGVSDGKLET